MRIVVLEDKIQAKFYKKENRISNDLIFPIGVGARHYSYKNNWKVLTIGDLIDKKDFLRARKESENRIEELLIDLNNYSIKISKNFQIKIGDYFSFQLYIIIGQIHYNYYLIQCVLKLLKPHSWLVYLEDSNDFFLDLRPNPKTVFQNILLNTLNLKNVKTILIKKNIKLKNKSIKNKIFNLVNDDVIKFLKLIKLSILTKNVFKNNRSKLLVLLPLYDWKKVLFDTTFQKKYFIKYYFGKIYKEKRSDKELRDIINKSISFSGNPVFNLSRLSDSIFGNIKSMDLKVKSLKKMLKNVKAILSTVYVYPWQNFIAHISKELTIPIINWQHGEMGLYEDPVTKYVEMKYTTHYLAYSKGAKKKYNMFLGKNYLEDVFLVGSTNKNISWSHKDYILYATGKWMKTAIPFDESLDFDGRLYNCQKDILTFLNSRGLDNKIIFKTNNTEGLSEIPYKFDNIKFENEIPFTKLLKKASLVILDCPSTTCIEAVSTRVPLFILNGRITWFEEPLELLKKRAVVADSTEELIKYVDDFLKNNNYQSDINNNEFFNEYGSNLKVNQVIKNNLNILQKIIK